MYQMTRKKNGRVVFGFNGKGASPTIIHYQITSLESAWLANEVENTRNASPPISATVSIRVPTEVRPVIVSMHVQLDLRSLEIDAEKGLDFGQNCPKSLTEGWRRLYGAGKSEKISVAAHGAKTTLLTKDLVKYVLCIPLREKVDNSIIR